MRIREDKALIPLEFKGRHHRDSHKAAAVSRITEHQKQALTTIVRTNPLCRAKSARRATQNMDDKSKIPPEMKNRVRRNVLEIRKEYYSELVGMQMSGKYQDLEQFATQHSIGKAVQAHNDSQTAIG